MAERSRRVVSYTTTANDKPCGYKGVTMTCVLTAGHTSNKDMPHRIRAHRGRNANNKLQSFYEYLSPPPGTDPRRSDLLIPGAIGPRAAKKLYEEQIAGYADRIRTR